MSWSDLRLTPPIQRSFRAERAAELTMPAALVLLEGGVVGVIAAKIYKSNRLRWRLSVPRQCSPTCPVFLESAISRTFKNCVCLRAASLNYRLRRLCRPNAQRHLGCSGFGEQYDRLTGAAGRRRDGTQCYLEPKFCEASACPSDQSAANDQRHRDRDYFFRDRPATRSLPGQFGVDLLVWCRFGRPWAVIVCTGSRGGSPPAST